MMSPSALQKIGNEFAIAWSDGSETFLSLEILRLACPCASCQGEPDVMGQVARPAQDLPPGCFDLTGWEVVGGYGLQPTWGDGHRTGIFSFSHLQRLGEGGKSQ